MMKGTLRLDGRTIHLLGLSRGNLDRLLADQAIHFDGAELGIAGHDFWIFFQETERDMLETFARLIGPETTVRIDPRVR